MREPTRLLIVDDHPVVTYGITQVVEASPITVVGAARNVQRALPLVDLQRPDVALVDCTQLATGAWSAVRDIARRTAVLLFTASSAHPSVQAATDAGAVGWVGKNADRQEIIRQINRAAGENGSREPNEAEPSSGHAGDRAHVSATETSAYQGRRISTDLTLRQRQILRGVAAGETNQEIAQSLNLSPNTIKTYWQQTLRKLAARNRVEAVSTAHRLGLL